MTQRDTSPPPPRQALSGLRVADLSRVLAGPYCSQILGDLGAEIIKIEKPGAGDDTRGWGPPYLQDKDGSNTSESAYYLSCNRNKKSIAIDISDPAGQELVHRILEQSDIMIENFKTGALAKYGLDYDSVRKRHPHIIYASITGFGQTGPMAQEPGYDFLAQAMSGLMAITGEKDGQPMKIGVALSDIMTGLNAAIGILAALHHRKTSGMGQHVDVALLDTSVSALSNIAQYYLTSGLLAPRLGNAHSTIVPYQVFEAKDGHVILAIGNNGQFNRFCAAIGHEEWGDDDRFATNPARVVHRDLLVPMIATIMARHSVEYWVDLMQRANVPCGPVNTMDKVFEMEQIKAREMVIEMQHSLSAKPIKLVGNPIKLSDTPAQYTFAPPPCGAQTQEILDTILDMNPQDIADLRARGVIE